VFLRGLDPATYIGSSDPYFAGEDLQITWENGQTEESQKFFFADSSGVLHDFNLSWIGFVAAPPPSLFGEGDLTQNIHFEAKCIDCESSTTTALGFTAVMRPTSDTPLVGLIPDAPGARYINFGGYKDSSSSASSSDEESTVGQPEDGPSDEFDLEGEVETLRLLEHQAHHLEAQISARRKAIAYTLKQDRDKLCIKHLIKECDGVACAARAVLQRLCDKVGIRTDPTYGFARLQKAGLQKSIAFHPDQKLDRHNCTDEKAYSAEGAHVPLIQTKGEEYQFKATYNHQAFTLVNASNPVLVAMQIIAGLLGITAIIAFIKKRCMSIRKRQDRAADLEERRNARAYRRAARRAMMRKRWTDFLGALNCFGCKHAPIMGDYEEKRALILQDAFLEQDLDHAEKGEVMEAEIRELRCAHEIVSSLVRVDEHRYAIATPVRDPPPSMVPLPPPRYVSRPQSMRSRANSQYTLPSYFSESLPDYSSRPGDETDGSSSVVNGYTPSTSESRGRDSPVSPISDTSHQTRSRYTPTSSVLEMSPRASAETLRTRPSGDRQWREQSLDSVLRL